MGLSIKITCFGVSLINSYLSVYFQDLVYIKGENMYIDQKKNARAEGEFEVSRNQIQRCAMKLSRTFGLDSARLRFLTGRDGARTGRRAPRSMRERRTADGAVDPRSGKCREMQICPRLRDMNVVVTESRGRARSACNVRKAPLSHGATWRLGRPAGRPPRLVSATCT